MSDPSILRIHSFRDIILYISALLTDARYFVVLATLVILGDAALTQLIIRFVPYTEIDWETYMIQLGLYLDGERDYAFLQGPTGPLVYPAGHLYVHQVLHALTNKGVNVAVAQQVYGFLYLQSLALACAIYHQAGGIPNWVILLLPLSKRLHSIFVLRLFNDCWALVAAQAATLAFGAGWDFLGLAFYSAALSVKMSVLLYFPAILVILFKRRGVYKTVLSVLFVVAVQLFIGAPFLFHNPRSYLAYSFELTRAFFYKWTVNWRFVSEETFLSPGWARALLFGHLVTLFAFGWFKWCRQEGGVISVLSKGLRNPLQSPNPMISADYVTTVLFMSNLVGILFARSLHYQFYSWYAQQLPFIAWRTKYPIVVKILLLAAIEYAWNVYPSTSLSSGVLLAANSLLVIGVWFGYPEGVTAVHKAHKIE
ncbi:hypothetical protein NLI96_g9958 [Meripilus lineatus]|uniref:Dol-P-Man:Man(5)GlcNAc(2)-PP-Dol alpha-1,3-mannosyltransferase n=1 Tax=Meripilus lineatus TaxID=2056292 RepID=A0AAD5YAI6_9APHY|nr:hypothetical protein NLI96_g9958 [Physisporinus lineatus]